MQANPKGNPKPSLDNADAKSNRTENSTHESQVHVLTVHLFFDGTGNNKFNTEFRENNMNLLKLDHGFADDISYNNDLSNIARMQKALDVALKANSENIVVYMEGIGTDHSRNDEIKASGRVDEETDHTRGMAFATGDTGIEARVNQAFVDIKKAVLDKTKNGDTMPLLVHFNVFGFSRGAAAARRFVNMLNDVRIQPEERSKRFSADWASVIVNTSFVGIFDTVPSQGVHVTAEGYIGNREEVRLAFDDDGAAAHVFHICSLEDFRVHFEMFDISSACGRRLVVGNGESKAQGQEIRIPGAHSDIGGGYLKQGLERRTWYQGTVRDFLYEGGWYREDDGRYVGRPRKPGDTSPLENVALDTKPKAADPNTHARIVSNAYCYIPLIVMSERAIQMQVPFNRAAAQLQDWESNVTADANLSTILGKLRSHVASSRDNASFYLEDMVGPQAAKDVRHQYFHMSFNYDQRTFWSSVISPSYEANRVNLGQPDLRSPTEWQQKAVPRLLDRLKNPGNGYASKDADHGQIPIRPVFAG